MAVRTSHVLRTSKSPLSTSVGPSVTISTAASSPGPRDTPDSSMSLCTHYDARLTTFRLR